MVPDSEKHDAVGPAPERQGEQPLSRAEIAAHQAAAATAHERRRWHVIGLAAEQVPLPEIAAITGYRPRTIREIIQRYQDSGAGALIDRRAAGRGALPLLSASLQQELAQLLLGPPPEGGSWTGPLVARWIAEQTGRRVHRQRGWEYLRRLRGAADPDRAGASSVKPDDASLEMPT